MVVYSVHLIHMQDNVTKISDRIYNDGEVKNSQSLAAFSRLLSNISTSMGGNLESYRMGAIDVITAKFGDYVCAVVCDKAKEKEKDKIRDKAEKILVELDEYMKNGGEDVTDEFIRDYVDPHFTDNVVEFMKGLKVSKPL